MNMSADSNAFFSSTDGYDRFMGRYSVPLARQFVKSIPLAKGDAVLEIGCGPGALTKELVALLGAESVSAIDPSPPFLKECARRIPGIAAEIASAEAIPFADQAFDAVFSQLVIHFIQDLPQAGREIVRVTRPGGWVSVCTWNTARMELINLVPRAAHAVGIETPQMRIEGFEDDGSVGEYLESIGLTDVSESKITVRASYSDFDDLWESYLLGIGPLGPWTLSIDDESRAAIRMQLFTMVGEPAGEFSLSGEARSAHGRTPA